MTGRAPAPDTGRELTVTRTIEAPRALVWRAWTDPQWIRQWWRPDGFTVSSCELELRVGGAFRLTMHAPDGSPCLCQGTYREIVEPERLVYDSDAGDGHPCGAGLPPRSVVTVTFTEQAGRTTVTLHTHFASGALRDAADRAGFSTGWGESLRQLTGILTARP